MNLHYNDYPKRVFDLSQDVGELDKKNTDDDRQDKCPEQEALKYSYSDFSVWFLFLVGFISNIKSSFDYGVEFNSCQYRYVVNICQNFDLCPNCLITCDFLGF